jgi:hypothetical protein
MRLKPGCGCLVLVLAVVNAFVAISALVGFVQGTTGAAVSLFMIGIFVSNVALCTMVGVQSIRSRRVDAPSSADGEEIGDAGEDEGEETGDAEKS